MGVFICICITKITSTIDYNIENSTNTQFKEWKAFHQKNYKVNFLGKNILNKMYSDSSNINREMETRRIYNKKNWFSFNNKNKIVNVKSKRYKCYFQI